MITGIGIVKTIFDLYGTEFKWKNTPYEYVFDKNPFDIISGTEKTRNQIESSVELFAIQNSWKNDEQEFYSLREKYLLY